MQQNLTLTYTKAVGIILMVLAHCSHFILVYQIVYSFHMPLFFIVSGYCFKEKYLHEPYAFVWKRIKGLWWPYVKWGMLFLLFHNELYRLHIYDETCGQRLYDTGDFISQAESILIHMFNTEPFPGGFWFLRALFFGSLIAYIMLKVIYFISNQLKCDYRKVCVMGGGFSLMLWILVNYLHKTFTLFYISPTELMATTFFVCGHCLAQWKVPAFVTWQSILAFSLLVINSFYNLVGIGGPFYETQKIVPYTITAILGTWCVYSAPWSKMHKMLARFMEYAGNHTLTILTWHFLCFKIVSLWIIIVYDLPIERLAEIPTIGEYDNRGWFILSTIGGIGIPLLIRYLYDRACPVVSSMLHSH